MPALQEEELLLALPNVFELSVRLVAQFAQLRHQADHQLHVAVHRMLKTDVQYCSFLLHQLALELQDLHATALLEHDSLAHHDNRYIRNILLFQRTIDDRFVNRVRAR